MCLFVTAKDLMKYKKMTDLERLGNSILNYFLNISSSNENIILHIDELTYKKCAYSANLSEEKIDTFLSGKGFNCFNSSNEYECLAIVALEIKLGYDIETDSDLIGSYNRRLVKNITGFHSESDVQIWYRSYQENIWVKVSGLFKKENRYLDIPEFKERRGRYVQFPLSQRFISGTQIINYADCFINKYLEPGRLITYSEFKKIIFRDDTDERVKRIIFNFYSIWDGRSAEELKNKCKYTKNNTSSYSEDEIYIKFDETIEVFVNQEKIDLNKSSIPENFLFSLDYNTFYRTRKGIRFLQDDDYKDWIPSFSKVELEEEVLLITNQKEIPFYLKQFEEIGEIKIRKQGLYSFLLICSKKRDAYNECKISLREKSCFELIGGIKAKRNTYYDFAKPTIKILTQEDSYKQTYNEIYIDSKKYPIDTNIVKIPDDISCGKHRLKFWDSTEYVFSILETEGTTQIPELHGWSFNYQASECSPAEIQKDVIIDGLEVMSKLKLYSRSITSQKEVNLRPFILRKNKLENRFVHKITKINDIGGIYGRL